jgi:hypothetical protein
VVGQKPPIGGAVSLKGRITDPADKVLRIDDFNLNLAGSDLAGWLQVSYGKMMKLKAEFSSDKLDLRPLIDQAPASSQGSSRASGKVSGQAQAQVKNTRTGGSASGGSSKSASPGILPGQTGVPQRAPGLGGHARQAG